MKRAHLFFVILLVVLGCSRENENINPQLSNNLTIFFVNDQHGQLANFSKIKDIVDRERAITNVILACSGDIFSGNPIVDNYAEKGFPMIDVMNKVGFDISVLGNHEFDYGEQILRDRVNQSDFDWVCANIDMGTSGVPEPSEYKTIVVGDLKVTFLGLVETNGKPNATIPLTHPWRVQNLIFERPENVVSRYSNIKEQENSDLFIALTHLGYRGREGEHIGDVELASQFPYFDLIVGGHSHQVIDDIANNTPIYQAGSNLNFLGKIKLTVQNRSVISANFELIDLNAHSTNDNELKKLIEDYEASATYLQDVIGFSELNHSRTQVGCFYTDALKEGLNVDATFQNSGGVRSSLDQGDISKREIYEIDPFNNGTVIYTMSIAEIKAFLKNSRSGYYYSGIQIDQDNDGISISNLSGNILSDNANLTIGINDFIPAVYDEYFPPSGDIQPLTTAETIISYLENTSNNVDYPSCTRFFKYQ